MLKTIMAYVAQIIRIILSGFCLYLVYLFTQPWALELYSELEFPGWIQVSLFAIAAGGIFPRSRQFSFDNETDIKTLMGGVWALFFGLLASFLP